MMRARERGRMCGDHSRQYQKHQETLFFLKQTFRSSATGRAAAFVSSGDSLPGPHRPALRTRRCLASYSLTKKSDEVEARLSSAWWWCVATVRRPQPTTRTRSGAPGKSPRDI